MISPTDTPKRLSDAEVAAQLLALEDFLSNVDGHDMTDWSTDENGEVRGMDEGTIDADDAYKAMNALKSHIAALKSHIAALTAPPSQGKVERAREAASSFYEHIKHGDEKHRAWLKEECDGKLFDLITQALTEPSGQMDPEAAAILRTLGCVPDSTDLSETDAKVSVGFLRRLIESSGQGTDGAEVRVFLQDVIDAMNGDGPAFKWRDDSDADALDYLGMKAEHLLRALPLPVSADGSRKAYLEMTVAELQKERGTIDMLLQRKVLGDPRIGVSFGPKQPSDTEKS